MAAWQEITEYLPSAAIVAIIAWLLANRGGFDVATIASTSTLACLAAALAVIAGRAAGWALAIPTVAALQLLPIGSEMVSALLPADRWLFSASGDAGFRLPSVLSAYPYATVCKMVAWAAYGSVFVLATAVRQPSARRLLLGSLLALGMWQSLEGINQVLEGRQIDSAELWAHGAFVSRNHYAAFLLASLGAAIALASELVSERAAEAASAGRSVVLVTTLLIGVGILASQSRAGIALAALVAAGWAFEQRRRWTLAAGFVVPLFVFAPAEYTERLATLTTDLRFQVWSDTLDAIVARPWTGGGLGAFPYLFQRSEPYLPLKSITHAHNDYLEFAAELGIPLAALIVVALSVALLRAAKYSPGCALGAGAVLLHALVDSPLEAPAVAATTAALLGLCHNRHNMAGRETQSRRPGLARNVWAAAIPLGFAALALALRAGLFAPWNAEQHYANMQRALAAGDKTTSRVELRRTLHANPRSAAAWVQAATFARAAGDVEMSRDQFTIARRLAPYSFRTGSPRD